MTITAARPVRGGPLHRTPPPPRRRMITKTAWQLAPASLERTDRTRWLELRRAGIGGSDIAAVMGLADFGRTAWQTYLDKAGAIPLDDRAEDGGQFEELMWFGHEMEAVAAKRFRMTNPGTKLARVGMLAHVDYPWLRVNLDRIVTGCPLGSPCLLEFKNRNAYASGQWDRGGDGEDVPDGPALQVHHGLIITGYSHGHLAAVIGGNELREYVIDANPDLHETMFEEARWFWEDCVLAGNPPPVDATERTGRLLAKLWEADPESVKITTPEIEAKWAELRAAQARAADAADAADLLKHELAMWLGTAEYAMTGDGVKRFTWKQNGTFREADFRQADPGQWAAYSRTVPVTDTRALAAADPALYRAWRSRTFKVYAPPKPPKPRKTRTSEDA